MKSVSVRAVFPNEGGILHSGASGRIVLELKENNIILIPCSATFELQDLIFAYKYVEGKAVSTRLNVEPTDDGKNYLVRDGLKAGSTFSYIKIQWSSFLQSLFVSLSLFNSTFADWNLIKLKKCQH